MSDKIGFGQAIAVGAKTVMKNIKDWIDKAPERAEVAHNTKLTLLERQRSEMEAENKVMKLEKEREKYVPKQQNSTTDGLWQFDSRNDQQDMWDKMI